MICYTSGTGNSRFVAEFLANCLNSSASDIFSVKPEKLIPGDIEGLVMPVYAWGVPMQIVRFITMLPKTFNGSKIWCVFTCGDETGMAPEILSGLLKRKGIFLSGVWSVIMPNNYVLLPGFDVDPKDIEKAKLSAAPERIKEIASSILMGNMQKDVTRGAWPRLKSGVVYPLFKRWGIFPKKWKVSDTCIKCGKCASVCPAGNVSMDSEGKICWGENCISCLACYHICPRQAVAYGRATLKKGQYFCPERWKN